MNSGSGGFRTTGTATVDGDRSTAIGGRRSVDGDRWTAEAPARD
ncbi:hypothetical protein [Streptomyces mirabilis]|nr:hypothetical protein [Streptomyces mirabilis]